MAPCLAADSLQPQHTNAGHGRHGGGGTPALAPLLLEAGTSMHIAAQAKAEGFNDLRVSALKKVAGGLASQEETNRITVD